jgi:hypothetical protein
MRRLTVVLLMLISATSLAACGDTGDHFGEFRQAPPPPTVVDQVILTMPLIASKNTGHASLKLYVTGYNNGAAIPQSVTLSTPIIVRSNWSGLTMLVNGKQVTAAAFGSAPGPISVTYNAPARPCNPVVGFAAYNQTASPQTDVVDAVKC